MAKVQRWHATTDGDQAIELGTGSIYTVTWSAEADCMYDAGRSYGEPGDCYESESDIDNIVTTVIITDDAGDVVDEASDLGKLIMSEFDDDAVADALINTTPDDYREDRRDYKELDF